MRTIVRTPTLTGTYTAMAEVNKIARSMSQGRKLSLANARLRYTTDNFHQVCNRPLAAAGRTRTGVREHCEFFDQGLEGRHVCRCGHCEDIRVMGTRSVILGKPLTKCATAQDMRACARLAGVVRLSVCVCACRLSVCLSRAHRSTRSRREQAAVPPHGALGGAGARRTHSSLASFAFVLPAGLKWRRLGRLRRPAHTCWEERAHALSCEAYAQAQVASCRMPQMQHNSRHNALTESSSVGLRMAAVA